MTHTTYIGFFFIEYRLKAILDRAAQQYEPTPEEIL